MKLANGETARYFWEHVADVTAECMIWPYGKTGPGYGMVRLDGRPTRAHVAACEYWHGPRPPGKLATHGPCHNRACWNGAHLSWGTPTENFFDRERDGTRCDPPRNNTRGEQRSQAKLTEAAVRDIRLRVISAPRGTRAQLAREYGVTKAVITAVTKRETWAHVE